MSFDILKPFRGCFVCNSFGDRDMVDRYKNMSFEEWSNRTEEQRREIEGIYLKRVKGIHRAFGWPFSSFYYYHGYCLENVLRDPQRYGNKKSDMAIQVAHLINEERDFFNRKAQLTHAMLERLHPETVSKGTNPGTQQEPHSKSRYDIAKGDTHEC